MHGCSQEMLCFTGRVALNFGLDWSGKLAGLGLQIDFLTPDCHPRTRGCVEGSTQVLALVDVPTCIAGLCGISRWAETSDVGTSSVPLTVPVSLFEGLRAVCAFARKLIRFKTLQDEDHAA